MHKLTKEEKQKAVTALEKTYYDSVFTPAERMKDLGEVLAFLAKNQDDDMPHNGIAVIRECLQFNYIMQTGHHR